ncbi:MAG TPA: hypothetical protein VN081_07065 [Dongiaceae bacterium]|nr:hypothetical protein [Dongiaceae bacterium]
MSDIDNGGPAFPTENEHQSGANTYHYEGMQLRDYFAAKALPIAAQDELLHPSYDEATYRGTAERAYLYADAMLQARKS